MSVLKSKRTESKAEYVNVANAIYIISIHALREEGDFAMLGHME